MTTRPAPDTGPLLLVDIDRVLAMYRGGDCRPGFPIYRTGSDVAETLRESETLQMRVAIVTHRARSEALCILEAIGLHGWSDKVVSASDLLRKSVTTLLVERRMHGLSKAVAGGILKDRFGDYDSRRSVMIDDKFSNLLRMTEAGVVRFGILTPSIVCDESGVRSFDLRKVLDLAVALSGSPTAPIPAGIHPEPVSKDIPDIFSFPLGSELQAEDELHTGHTLAGSSLEVVTILRKLKRLVGGS